MPEPDDKPAPEAPAPRAQPTEREAFERAGRVFKRFLVPFLLSWVLAYAGSARELEWLYFAGLGGVGLSMLGLMLWLIH